MHSPYQKCTSVGMHGLNTKFSFKGAGSSLGKINLNSRKNVHPSGQMRLSATTQHSEESKSFGPPIVQFNGIGFIFIYLYLLEGICCVNVNVAFA